MQHQKNPTKENDMRKVVVLEVVIDKLQTILKKDENYCNKDTWGSKWTQINKKCIKFHSIYNKLFSHEQCGVTDLIFLERRGTKIMSRHFMFFSTKKFGRLLSTTLN